MILNSWSRKINWEYQFNKKPFFIGSKIHENEEHFEYSSEENYNETSKLQRKLNVTIKFGKDKSLGS